MKSPSKVVALLTVPFVVAFVPPVFDRLFAMRSLLPRERTMLWVLAVGLSAIVFVLGRRTDRRGEKAALVLFGLLLLASAELATRATVRFLRPDRMPRLAALGDASYPDLAAYVGHPFLEFTGRPGTKPRADAALAESSEFNRLGFPDRDVPMEKPAGVVRIAAIGGSTTASGYPRMLEEILNGDAAGTGSAKGGDQATDPASRFEVLNFGLSFYTTAHSLVNLVLNVIDFDPDYLVIHHAWNDEKARRASEGFRDDYGHAFHPFHPPASLDRYFVRASVIYRLLIPRPPAFAYVESSIMNRFAKTPGYDDPRQLAPFRRNIRTMIDVAVARGIRPVLTTMPHSTDPAKPYQRQAAHVDQANAALRAIARSYGDRVLFVDLDAAMTGKMEESFRDLAHVDERGRREKARCIAAVIERDRETQSSDE
jgi:hypothetical protein